MVTSRLRQVVSSGLSLSGETPPSPSAQGVHVEVRVWTPESWSADGYGVGVRKVT